MTDVAVGIGITALLMVVLPPILYRIVMGQTRLRRQKRVQPDASFQGWTVPEVDKMWRS